MKTMKLSTKDYKALIQLTAKQKERYVQEYLYDELCEFDLNNKKELIKHFGTENIIEIVQGIIAYPLSHHTIQDMHDHMDEKYFHLLSEKQIEAWEHNVKFI